MTEHVHSWLYMPGGDVSITKAREMGIEIPDHIVDPGDMPYAIFVAGYWFCSSCGFKSKVKPNDDLCTYHR